VQWSGIKPLRGSEIKWQGDDDPCFWHIVVGNQSASQLTELLWLGRGCGRPGKLGSGEAKEKASQRNNTE
jgi:hypothetical protein